MIKNKKLTIILNTVLGVLLNENGIFNQYL